MKTAAALAALLLLGARSTARAESRVVEKLKALPAAIRGESWKAEGLAGWSAVVSDPEHTNGLAAAGGLYRQILPEQNDEFPLYAGLELTALSGHRNAGKFSDTDVDGDGRSDPLVFTSGIETKVISLMAALRLDGTDPTGAGELTGHFSLAAGAAFRDTQAGTQTLQGVSSNGTDQTGRTISRPARFLVQPAYGGSLGCGYLWRSGLEAGLVLRYEGFIGHGRDFMTVLIPAVRLSWTF